MSSTNGAGSRARLTTKGRRDSGKNERQHSPWCCTLSYKAFAAIVFRPATATSTKNAAVARAIHRYAGSRSLAMQTKKRPQRKSGGWGRVGWGRVGLCHAGWGGFAPYPSSHPSPYAIYRPPQTILETSTQTTTTVAPDQPSSPFHLNDTRSEARPTPAVNFTTLTTSMFRQPSWIGTRHTRGSVVIILYLSFINPSAGGLTTTTTTTTYALDVVQTSNDIAEPAVSTPPTSPAALPPPVATTPAVSLPPPPVLLAQALPNRPFHTRKAVRTVFIWANLAVKGWSRAWTSKELAFRRRSFVSGRESRALAVHSALGGQGIG